MAEKIKKFIGIALFVIALIFVGHKFYMMNNSLVEAGKIIKTLTAQNGQLVIDLAKAKDDYIELESKQKSNTVIQYIEKTSPDDADFQIDKKPPKVIVNAGDGVKYEYTPDTKSMESIKDGKVVITEDNTLTLDIEKITDARFKDKIEAINSKHKLDLEEKNKEIDKLNRKLKITRKQRDFYGGVAGLGIIGIGIQKSI